RRDGSRKPRPRCVPRLELLEDRLAPATLMVTNNNDSGAGSLRQAIYDSVNRTGLGTGNDTIQFSPTTMDGATITLTTLFQRPLLFDLVGPTMAGPSAFFIYKDPFVTDNNANLVIDGETGLTKGITIERFNAEGAAPFRLFDVDASASLTLKGL